MKCPDELDREELWRLLGAYAVVVGRAEGVSFTENKWVNEAGAQYYAEHDRDEINNVEAEMNKVQ